MDYTRRGQAVQISGCDAVSVKLKTEKNRTRERGGDEKVLYIYCRERNDRRVRRLLWQGWQTNCFVDKYEKRD